MLTPPFFRYYHGEPKKTNEEISYLIILFFLEQNINSLQYITHKTILATQIMNHEIAAHRVKELLSKSSGQVYQLLDLIGISHDI